MNDFRDEILAGLASGTITPADADSAAPRRLTLTKGGIHLSLARAADLRKRVEAIFEEFESADDPDGITLAGLVAIYPIEP